MTEQRPARIRPRHRMVDRVASIIEAVARSTDGMSLTEIARRIDAPLSTAQGLVNGLVTTGYLDERARTYRLGVTPYLINLLAGRGAVNRVGHDDLVALHEETGGTTAVLSVAVGQDVVYIDHCSTDPTTAYLAERFVRRSLIRTSGGWVLLADWESRDLWTYLGSLGPEDQDRVDRLLESLEEIRATGACSLPGASEKSDVDGMSVAVREGGRTVAAVGVVGPRRDLRERGDQVLGVLRRHAASWHARD